jgi:hypothetical protein
MLSSVSSASGCQEGHFTRKSKAIKGKPKQTTANRSEQKQSTTNKDK